MRFDLSKSSSLKEKLTGVAELHDFLSAGSVLPSDQIDETVDNLTTCISDNNFRVSSGALDCLSILVATTPSAISSRLSKIIPAAVNRLGDTKQAARDSSIAFLSSMLSLQSPQSLWEYLSPLITSPNANAKESLIILCSDIHESEKGGWGSVSRDVVAGIVSLLTDRKPAVRDNAVATISKFYNTHKKDVLAELSNQNIRDNLKQDIETSAHYDKTKSLVPSQSTTSISLAKPTATPKGHRRVQSAPVKPVDQVRFALPMNSPSS
ncbi:hypothetical protein GEMRC1_006597 [Eukaryota sp. GEM-RC1]